MVLSSSILKDKACKMHYKQKTKNNYKLLKGFWVLEKEVSLYFLACKIKYNNVVMRLYNYGVICDLGIGLVFESKRFDTWSYYMT